MSIEHLDQLDREHNERLAGVNTQVAQQARTGSNLKPDQTLVVWGWITTFLFPIAGLVIAIILLARGQRKGHGGAMLGITIAWFTMWIVIFAVALGSAAVEASAGIDAYNACIDSAQTLAQMNKC